MADKSTGRAELAAAGFTVITGAENTPVFKDCGVNPTSC